MLRVVTGAIGDVDGIYITFRKPIRNIAAGAWARAKCCHVYHHARNIQVLSLSIHIVSHLILSVLIISHIVLRPLIPIPT